MVLNGYQEGQNTTLHLRRFDSIKITSININIKLSISIEIVVQKELSINLISKILCGWIKISANMTTWYTCIYARITVKNITIVSAM